MNSKTISELTVKISVEDAKASLMKAVHFMISDLEAWEDTFREGGYWDRAEEVRDYIEALEQYE